MNSLKLYNTADRKVTDFEPVDSRNIKIYACGPTVYDFIHIGNARPLVIFDILVRLLRKTYPKVTYVRNITDIDDKINKRAFKEGISISQLTSKTIKNKIGTEALNEENLVCKAIQYIKKKYKKPPLKIGQKNTYHQLYL